MEFFCVALAIWELAQETRLASNSASRGRGLKSCTTTAWLVRSYLEKIKIKKPAVVTAAFKPSLGRSGQHPAGRGRRISVSLRPTWSMQ